MRFSIPTRYNGTLYRSKLEADWARTFDKLGVDVKYEHEGHYFGDVFYLPDFYLPATGQFVEVKPSLRKVEWRKAAALCLHAPRGPHEPEWAITEANRGYADGDSLAPYALCLPNGEFVVVTRMAGYAQKSGLYRCAECRAWWFLDTHNSHACRACGAGAAGGDDHILDSACNLRRRLPDVWWRR